MKQPFTITEYGSFVCGKSVAGYTTLPERTFEALENFILSSQDKDTEPLELMGLSARKGIGKIITAKNYVGIITMKDGTSIEILPKIHSASANQDIARTKKLLLDMLKTLRSAPYKTMQTSNLDIAKMNIFEIFVRMFIDEVFFIVKRGLKCSYGTIEENTTYFKGKMKFSQHIKLNHSHKEHNYVEYDVFTADRPENRLLKSTLMYLYKQSRSSKNRSDIKVLLTAFGDVPPSTDYMTDFAKHIPDRHIKDYTTALLWCRIFLQGKSFTSYSGSEVAIALLFPMETLFESYIAALTRKALVGSGCTLSTQDERHYLFDKPQKQFRLRPDIVITNGTDNIFIMDTKWKILSSQKHNYGISQADMYQMYAYQKKYNAKNVTLLYPATENTSDNGITFSSEDGVTVYVKFVDMFDAPKSIKGIMEDIILKNSDTNE